MRQLAAGWKHEPQIFELLKQQVVSDAHWGVRREAVRQLATGWKHEPQIFELLKQQVVSDDDSDVRLEAVRQLATGWKHESQMLELFHNSALNDPFQRENDAQDNPRQTALEAIAKQYPDHPQTLPLLQNRAENDSDKKLREWARKKLQRFENRER